MTSRHLLSLLGTLMICSLGCESSEPPVALEQQRVRPMSPISIATPVLPKPTAHRHGGSTPPLRLDARLETHQTLAKEHVMPLRQRRAERVGEPLDAAAESGERQLVNIYRELELLDLYNKEREIRVMADPNRPPGDHEFVPVSKTTTRDVLETLDVVTLCSGRGHKITRGAYSSLGKSSPKRSRTINEDPGIIIHSEP